MEVKAQVPLIGQLSGFPASLHPGASPTTPSTTSAKKPLKMRDVFISSALNDLLFKNLARLRTVRQEGTQSQVPRAS
jgi:hypothetical protein